MKRPLGSAEARNRVGAELELAWRRVREGSCQSRAAVLSPPSPGLSRKLGQRPELEDARAVRPERVGRRRRTAAGGKAARGGHPNLLHLPTPARAGGLKAGAADIQGSQSPPSPHGAVRFPCGSRVFAELPKGPDTRPQLPLLGCAARVAQGPGGPEPVWLQGLRFQGRRSGPWTYLRCQAPAPRAWRAPSCLGNGRAFSLGLFCLISCRARPPNHSFTSLALRGGLSRPHRPTPTLSIVGARSPFAQGWGVSPEWGGPGFKRHSAPD